MFQRQKAKKVKLSKFSQSWSIPNKNILIVRVIIDKFPYIHADFHAIWKTKDGDKKLIFGVPYNKELGLAFYTFSNKGVLRYKEIPEQSKRKLKEVTNGEYPKCEFHDKAMIPTKHFKYEGKRNFQFKCPECFLCKRVNIDKNAGTQNIRIGVEGE